MLSTQPQLRSQNPQRGPRKDGQGDHNHGAERSPPDVPLLDGEV
jgi:hypothetical protein